MSELFAGVDLGGTSVKAVLADRDGVIAAEGRVPTESHQGPDAVLERIGDLVEQLAAEAGVCPAAVGMGVPGLVDLATGTTQFCPNLPTQWRGIPAAQTLSGRLGCRVQLLNDVRTATLGELCFGHGRGEPELTMVFFALGTGVGGGIVVEGRMRLGPLGAAGELGHQTILPEGLRCGCGNRGCLETLASGPALAAEGIRLMRSGLAPVLRDIVDGNADLVTPREMAEAADAGDARVRGAIEQVGVYIGIAAGNLVTSLHPELVVIGGGVAGIGDLLLASIRDEIHRRVGMFPTEDIRVEQSLLGEQAGVLGAVALAAGFERGR